MLNFVLLFLTRYTQIVFPIIKAQCRIQKWSKLLWYKLLCYGINSNLLENLKALYSRVNYCLDINGTCTECTVNRGVKQGCLLLPALFNLYINDLVPYVKTLNLGVNTKEDIVMCILLYADDIALFANNENDLQQLICRVATRCDKNSLAMNINKTKVLHIRPNRRARSSSPFSCNSTIIEYCNEDNTQEYGLMNIWTVSKLQNILQDQPGKLWQEFVHVLKNLVAFFIRHVHCYINHQ